MAIVSWYVIEVPINRNQRFFPYRAEQTTVLTERAARYSHQRRKPLRTAGTPGARPAVRLRLPVVDKVIE